MPGLDLSAEEETLDREVLIVEDMTEQQEHSLREELKRWRRPDDAFVYEIVVVPSIEDAIMAARLNLPAALRGQRGGRGRDGALAPRTAPKSSPGRWPANKIVVQPLVQWATGTR